MTTINNSENLIEKVGGIEKAREIVNGAPKGFDAYSFKEKKYVRSDWFLGEVSLNDLRTAISEHDEFKVGDLVVHPKFDNKKIYEIIEIKGDLFTVFYDRNSHSFRSDLRHATPEEIKAGHRLEAERHG
ncbi:hypothetical protein ACNPQK_01920 [Acinetobacter guillouiae]|uniref:hypothetical protein n=1 Tax=Acinetobacter guillouiae TaxID=106649 RepID=UPI003AF4CEF7